jgi:hypothetical protein
VSNQLRNYGGSQTGLIRAAAVLVDAQSGPMAVHQVWFTPKKSLGSELFGCDDRAGETRRGV